MVTIDGLLAECIDAITASIAATIDAPCAVTIIERISFHVPSVETRAGVPLNIAEFQPL